MSTPLSELLSLVAAHGKSQASAFLQGEAVIAGSPDQEIWEHLARHDILWDGLTVSERDQIRDQYLEGFKIEAARRLTPSDPDACESATSMEQFRIAHRAQIKLLREKLKDCESALERAERSPAASGVIPASLVPGAVKVAQDGSVCEVEPLGDCLERLRDIYITTCTRDQFGVPIYTEENAEFHQIINRLESSMPSSPPSPETVLPPQPADQ